MESDWQEALFFFSVDSYGTAQKNIYLNTHATHTYQDQKLRQIIQQVCCSIKLFKEVFSFVVSDNQRDENKFFHEM